MEPYDIICIGAGPTGLATAIEAKRAGKRPLVIDKACLWPACAIRSSTIR